MFEQVCDHFVLGFPYDWEEFGAQCFGEESTYGALPSRNTNSYGFKMSDDGAKCSLPISFDDLPVTRVCDLMMVPSGDYKECRLTRRIFDHILNIYGGSSVQLNQENNGQITTKDPELYETGLSLDSNEENNSPVTTENCFVDKALRDQVKNKVEQRYKNDNDISDATPMREVESQSMHNHSTMGVDVHWLREGVCTRSKKRSKALRNNQERGLSSNTFTKPVPTSEAVGSQCGETTAEKNASNVNTGVSTSQTIHCESTMGVDVNKLSEGLSPRSKNRSKTLTSNQKEGGLYSKISTKPVSMSEASGNQCGGMIAETDVSNVSRSAILFEENKEIGKILDSSGVGRSGRPKHLGGGVATRREYRSEISINNQEENLSSTTINPGLIDQISASEVPESQCRGTIASTIASNVSLPDKLSQEEMKETLNNSAARLSYQQKNFSTGVVTRSKAKLIRLRSDPEDNIGEVEVAVDDTAVRRSAHGKKLSVPFPTSEASGITKRDASCRQSSQEKKEINGASDRSAVRRSNRIRNLKQ